MNLVGSTFGPCFYLFSIQTGAENGPYQVQKWAPLTGPFLGPRAKQFHLPIQTSDEKAPNVLPTTSHVPKLWRPRTMDCFLMPQSPRYGVIFQNRLSSNAQPVFLRAILRKRYNTFFVESLRKTGGRWKTTNTDKSHHSATPSPKKASENRPLWFFEHAAAICITRASFFIAGLNWQVKWLGSWP